MRKHRSSAPSGPLPQKRHSFFCFAPLTCSLTPLCCAHSDHSLAFAGRNSQVFHRQHSLAVTFLWHATRPVSHYVRQSVHQSFSMFGSLSVHQLVSHSVCLSVCWSVDPSVHPSCIPFLGFGQKPILWASSTLNENRCFTYPW